MLAPPSWSRRALALVLVVVVSGCGGDDEGDDGPPPSASPSVTIAPTPLASGTTLTTPSPVATTMPAVAWATGSQLLRSDDGGFTWAGTGRGLVHAVSFADRVQELHIKVIHILIELVERNLFPENYPQAGA